MIDVRLDTPFSNWPFRLQTPGATGIWGNYRFHIDDERCDKADYWVALHSLHTAKACTVPASNVFLFNIEIPTTIRFPREFVRQFALIHTCGGFRFSHPTVIESQPAVPWWIGVNQRKPHSAAAEGHRGSYDEFKYGPLPPKTRLLSVISSNRLLSPVHVQRARFIDTLESRLRGQLDVLGPRPGEPDAAWINKWEAVAPYHYHIAIENGIYPHWWTEKLGDPFLVGTYPIYSGCPNVLDYFPEQSLATFDMQSIDKAVDRICRVIENDGFSSSVEPRRVAQLRILDQYNLFAEIAQLCDRHPARSAPQRVVLRGMRASESSFRKAYWFTRHCLMQRTGLRKLLGRSG